MANPLFSVAVITYNQESYIKDTIDNILSQVLEYKNVEIVIGDDCSRDSTRSILHEYKSRYPDIITLLLNEKNLGALANYYNVLKHCSGTYVMQCAGDDYWLDGKVKEQVAFMEANQEIGMAYTKCVLYDQAKGTELIYGGDSETFSRLVKSNVVPAPTVIFRKSEYVRYLLHIQPESRPWKMEDYPLWLWFSQNSKIKFIDKVTAVYRLLPESVSHSANIKKALAFHLSTIDVRVFFSSLGSDRKTLHAKDRVFRKYGKKAIQLRDYDFARECFIKIGAPTVKDRLFTIFLRLSEIKKNNYQ